MTTQTAAEMIAAEMEQVATEGQLTRFAADEDGSESLEQHQSLIRTRLGGDYVPSAWGVAMDILRERHATPTNLDELLAAIRAGRYTEQEMTNLPTFGGEEPSDTNGIWSWDERRLLVTRGNGNMAIIERGEA